MDNTTQNISGIIPTEQIVTANIYAAQNSPSIIPAAENNAPIIPAEQNIPSNIYDTQSITAIAPAASAASAASTPPAPLITPIWASEVPDKPLEWFYPNVFVQGELNGIQGISAAGKTWLMCELAAQTSTGGIVQGVNSEADCVQLPYGKVLYLSGDDSNERIKERLVAREADLSKIAFAPEGKLPQIGSQEMEQLFVQTEPALCVIDTIQHFIGKVSANDMTGMTAALQPLQALARKHNTAVIVIMHVSKYTAMGNNGGDSTTFYIGSYAIAGIFRTLWTLGRLKESDGTASTVRALCQSKNNYVEFDPPALLFELRNGFRWIGIDENITAEDLYSKKKSKGRPADKKDTVKIEVLKLLENGEPMLSAELEEKVKELTNCHSNTIAAVKKELGVESFQSGRQWFSRLPRQTETDAKLCETETDTQICETETDTQICQTEINAQTTINQKEGQEPQSA